MKINYKFKDKNLLQLALTQSGVDAKNNIATLYFSNEFYRNLSQDPSYTGNL